MQTQMIMKNENSTVTFSALRMSKIAVLDEQPLFRLGLMTSLKRIEGFYVAIECGDRAEFFTELIKKDIDAIILDIAFEGESNIEIIKDLRYRFGDVPILVLTNFEEMVFAKQAMRAGANGYIMKQASSDEIVRAIEAVMSGKMYLSERVYEILLEEATRQELAGDKSNIDALSSREFQIFLLMGKGMQPKEITDNLKLSRGTVEYDRKIMLKKFQLANLKELRDYAMSWVRTNNIN